MSFRGDLTKGPVTIDNFAVQHRILGPGVASSVTKTISNLFKGSGSQIFKSGGFAKSGQTLARSKRSISQANQKANPTPTNAPRTGPTISSVAKTGLVVGGFTAGSIAFTEIIGDITKPNPPGGTTGGDIVGGLGDISGNIGETISNNAGLFLILGGGVLLLLLIK